MNDKILQLISHCKDGVFASIHQPNPFGDGYKAAMENVLDILEERFPLEWEEYRRKNFDLGPNQEFA